MAMSHETRRRVIIVVVAIIVVALVLGSVGCSTTTGAGDADSAAGDAPLDASFYPATVTEICTATDERLARLPSPGVDIDEADWADEVSRALSDEAESLGDVGTIGDIRDDHRAFVQNTGDQAAAWQELSSALSTSDAEGIDSARTEILELARGRIDLALELSITGCRERSFGA